MGQTLLDWLRCQAIWTFFGLGVWFSHWAWIIVAHNHQTESSSSCISFFLTFRYYPAHQKVQLSLFLSCFIFYAFGSHNRKNLATKIVHSVVLWSLTLREGWKIILTLWKPYLEQCVLWTFSLNYLLSQED